MIMNNIIKTSIILILIFLFTKLYSQENQKAIIFGEVFYITTVDTFELSNARLELYKIENDSVEGKFVDYFYTDEKGRYIITDVSFGKYYFMVFYGKGDPYKQTNYESSSEKSQSFIIDLDLKMVPPMYLHSP